MFKISEHLPYSKIVIYMNKHTNTDAKIFLRLTPFILMDSSIQIDAIRMLLSNISLTLIMFCPENVVCFL